MKNKLLTISNSDWTKIKIKNSKFFSKAYQVRTKYEVEDILNKIKTENSNANHVVYAYRLLEDKKIVEYNTDAGEPAKSSGPPILKVIKGNQLIDVAIYVVRYFGGIKLGIGGLIKAYTNSAQLALKSAKIIEKINYKNIKIVTDYNDLGFILGKIEKHKGQIKNIEYDQKITIEFKITNQNLKNLKKDKQVKFD